MSESLPGQIPIFPLFGIILLPNTILPLRIFEPRYLQMLKHSLKNDQVIGIIQPREMDEEELYSIGCLGRIEHSKKQTNGNYMIRLQGEIRFRILRELETETLYRQVEVDYTAFAGDSQETLREKEMSLLYEAFKNYTARKTLQIVWEKLEKIPAHYLVNILCMNLEFTPLEKQALLEAPSLDERHDQLITLMKMAVAEEENSSTHFIN
ncbi:MAG: LON peptidase substrate-binding domain-containing protein [SAR324 cluster bacterium]|nr:LON peptidase substrate-binding domain-containing protein [SAR324 cluster bacterium]